MCALLVQPVSPVWLLGLLVRAAQTLVFGETGSATQLTRMAISAATDRLKQSQFGDGRTTVIGPRQPRVDNVALNQKTREIWQECAKAKREQIFQRRHRGDAENQFGPVAQRAYKVVNQVTGWRTQTNPLIDKVAAVTAEVIGP